MSEPDDSDLTYFNNIGLDDLTVARLMEVCEGAKVPPRAVIAAIVRDVLEDDALAHDPAEENGDVVRPDANKDLH